MEKAVEREQTRRKMNIQPADHQKTFVCLIDLKLAFDKVDRDLLIKEMIRINLPTEMTTLVAKILMNTSFDTQGGIKTF
jgi:hypothetical protein